MEYRGGLYKFIGVGSALLVLGRVGNARASKCGTSNMVRLPRFFCIVIIDLNLLL